MISNTPQNVDIKKLGAMVKALSGTGANAHRKLQLEIECAAQLATEHHDYALYAGNLVALDLQATCPRTFSDAMNALSDSIDPDILRTVDAHAKLLNSAIVTPRDMQFDVFGIRTLTRSYLLKTSDGVIRETPQYMYMRVALGIHKDNLSDVLDTYESLSCGYYTHATPTLFNSGTNQPQMSSCFLVAMKDDSIKGIFDTVSVCAEISKNAGGIGLHVHNIRAKGSHIQGTGGTSNGLVPMLRVFNNTARYVDQGGGKRMGSFAIYLEPWHADIFDFIDLKKNHGAEERRARDLFYALWVPDLFMQRVKNNEMWTLFCPTEAPGLADTWGGQFEGLYTHYEKMGVGRKKVKARLIWQKIVASQIETGMPYILFKDACNAKSNQQNLGTIKSSNLCSEIVQFSSPGETAVCNLASIALPKCVTEGSFNFKLLETITRSLVRNLNRVIDENYYPTKCAERSNKRHRPMGIGVQGLADVFQLMELAFESTAALELNEQIFETIYYAAVYESNQIARTLHLTDPSSCPYIPRGTYPSYYGSPAANGKLQFDLWGKVPSTRHNWPALKENIRKYGLRNSLLVSIMPTASTSQILGNNECCEPFTSNVYVRRVLAGEYIVVNKHLIRALSARGLWTDDVRTQLIADRGSVQHIDCVPPKLKRIFKTVWEIKQRVLIDMAAARGPYICQSQSMNLFLENPTMGKLYNMHLHSWESGLKTGCYYFRTRPAADPIQFTVGKRKRTASAGTAANEEPPSPNLLPCDTCSS